jgi:holo-[acyl-carrier protein] synthase
VGLRVGVDIVSVERFKKAVQRWGDNLLLRIFVDEEIDYCRRKARRFEHLAARFAAKEAIIKALEKKVALKDIIVKNEDDGAPKVFIKNKRVHISLSISHTEEFAIASCIVNDEDCNC